jgi:hypothetical protein
MRLSVTLKKSIMGLKMACPLQEDAAADTVRLNIYRLKRWFRSRLHAVTVVI